jgi:phage terminase large subunit-like protein
LWEAGGISGSDVKADRELRETYRDLCKRSLYFLTKAVLGYVDLTKRTHKEYADTLQNMDILRLLDLMPRGVFKTSIGTIGFTIFSLINNPNYCILIANQAARNASRMLEEIEGHLEGENEMMNWLFPEMIKPGDRWKPWSTERMTIPNRKVFGGGTKGTPSITILGVGAKAESMHFHIIINDDLIGREAMLSEMVMLDAISWHDYSVSLFVNPVTGIERIHGTRWSISDLYSLLIEDPSYEVFIRQAINEKTGELFFPERLTREELRRIRDRNLAHYMSQYENNPMNSELLDFKKEWLNYFSLIKTEEGPTCVVDGKKHYVKDMTVGLFVDPAASGDIEMNIAQMLKRSRAKKANNCVGIWGLSGDGKYFLLDMWVGRGKGENPELQVANEMLNMVLRWRGYVRKGYVESYGAQRALITIFNMLARERGHAFPMEETPRGLQKAKKVRIRSAIGPNAQNGNVFVRASHDQFITEFTTFPQSTTLDTLDMSAWAFITLRKPLSKVQKEESLRNSNKRKRRLLYRTGRTGY